MKYLFPLLFLVMSPSLFAAKQWFKDLTVSSAAYFWDGYNDVWAITWEESITTGCASADSGKKAAWFSNGGPSIFPVGNARLDPAHMALATGMKVDLFLDPANCNTFYGASWSGIRVHK